MLPGWSSSNEEATERQSTALGTMDHEQQTAQFAELMLDIRRINIDGETIELTYHLRKFAEIFQRYISDDRTLR